MYALFLVISYGYVDGFRGTDLRVDFFLVTNKTGSGDEGSQYTFLFLVGVAGTFFDFLPFLRPFF